MKNNTTQNALALRVVLFILVLAVVVGLSFLIGQNIRPAFQPAGAGPAQVAAGAGPGGGEGGTAAKQPAMNLKAMRFIIVKFAAWFVFIVLIAVFLRRGNWKRREKLTMYGISLFIFGIFFGTEPSPMHPVKDFIFRFGAMGKPVVLFLISFLVLLIISIILNRSICAWGCQFGVLQDFLHRLFRNKKDTKNVITKYKPPFWIGNMVRVLTFTAMVAAAFAFSYDVIGAFDPFKIFNPKTIGIGAGIFIGVIAVSSIFIYRPFCYFFCPFGLISWLASWLSIIKIRIDREKCTECMVCVAACPSHAMKGIYDGKKLPPDCYTCASCIASCPAKAISLSGRRKAAGSG